jgi:hypothetical protein
MLDRQKLKAILLLSFPGSKPDWIAAAGERDHGPRRRHRVPVVPTPH